MKKNTVKSTIFPNSSTIIGISPTIVLLIKKTYILLRCNVGIVMSSQFQKIMKRVSTMLILLFAVLFVNAQNDANQKGDDIKTVFGKGNKTKLGWFVGIDPAYSQFKGKNVWLAGINGGLIINHHFAIGLAGRAWVNRNELFYPDVTDTVGAYLEGGYGGFLFEYTLFPKSVIHVTFPVIIGGGGASYVTNLEYDTWEDGHWTKNHKSLDSDAFFVIEPGVRAEVNLLKFMRLNAGVSYRYVGDLKLINTSSDLMRNWAVTIGLKFGKF